MAQKKKIGYVKLNFFKFADDNLWQQLQLSYRKINFEINENGVDLRAL